MSDIFITQAFAFFPAIFCVLLLVYLITIVVFMKQSGKKAKLNLLLVFVGLSVLISVFLAYVFFQ